MDLDECLRETVCSVPFFIAAPTTTLDPRLESGSLIEIEERNPEELTHHAGKQTAAPGIGVSRYMPLISESFISLFTS